MKHLTFALIVLTVYLFISNATFDYDDTDDKINKKRSSIVLYTDYGTGLQYIKFGIFGSTQPRLDRNGKHKNIYNDK